METQQRRYGVNDALAAVGLIEEELREHGLDIGKVKDGVVLGSGLGAFPENHMDQDLVRIPFNRIFQALDLPLVEGEVPGHDRSLKIGPLKGTSEDRLVIAQAGREHPYEDIDTKRSTFWLRVMQVPGVEDLIGSYAAGILTPDTLQVPSLMLTRGQLDFGHDNPLVGPNSEPFGPRFPHSGDLYPKDTREMIMRVAKELGTPLKQGILVRSKGPEYEDAHRIYLFRSWLRGMYDEAHKQPGETELCERKWCGFGPYRDPVGVAGMSSTFEVMTIQHAKQAAEGYPAFRKGHAYLSAATNYAGGIGPKGPGAFPNHEEVKVNADLVADGFGKLVRGAMMEWRKAA